MIRLQLILLFLFISCTQPKIQTTKIPYNRSEWHHWIDSNKDCINTRHEILKSRSKIAVSYNRKKCAITRGEWDDYYYPEVHTLSKKIDIDHLVPLKHAHENGGAKWTKSQKEIFANDPENLVITNLKYNRKKGAKGIDEWLPVHEAYSCKYIRDWLKVKKKYSLNITPSETRSISSLRCENLW